jgi:hypothetical protein
VGGGIGCPMSINGSADAECEWVPNFAKPVSQRSKGPLIFFLALNLFLCLDGIDGRVGPFSLDLVSLSFAEYSTRRHNPARAHLAKFLS